MPMRALNLEGKIFGRLLVVRRSGSRHGKSLWVCTCVCGSTTHVTSTSLTRKIRPTRSCGCLVAIRSREANTRHGMRNTAEYQCWSAIKDRCHNPKSKDFSRYGGRGIAVCTRWRESFENFISDMGARPSPLHSIERKNNGGGYTPGNCRWATAMEQASNRRSSFPIGNYPTAAAAARAIGHYRSTPIRRIRRGLSVDQALSSSPRRVNPKPKKVRA